MTLDIFHQRDSDIRSNDRDIPSTVTIPSVSASGTTVSHVAQKRSGIGDDFVGGFTSKKDRYCQVLSLLCI
jgi:hypothetical protein